MAVDLEAIKDRRHYIPELTLRHMRPSLQQLVNEDVPAMFAEIESLRSTIAQMRAEIEEYRASVKCKQETVNFLNDTGGR